MRSSIIISPSFAWQTELTKGRNYRKRARISHLRIAVLSVDSRHYKLDPWPCQRLNIHDPNDLSAGRT